MEEHSDLELRAARAWCLRLAVIIVGTNLLARERAAHVMFAAALLVQATCGKSQLWRT